jgi:hypothetical protein
MNAGSIKAVFLRCISCSDSLPLDTSAGRIEPGGNLAGLRYVARTSL